MTTRNRSMSRRRFLKLGVIASGGAVLAACAPTTAPAPAPPATQAPAAAQPTAAAAATPTPEPHRAAPTGRKTAIQFYQPWGGTSLTGLLAVVDAFEKSRSDIGVEVISMDWPPQKLYTAVAAGKPPDVAVIPPNWMGSVSELGAIVPLDDYLKKDGLTRDQFFPAVWDSSLYQGKQFGLPIEVDVNFALAWNKDLFQKNGLDPASPPKSIDDLNALQDKLTVKQGDQIVQTGIVPWSFGGTASLISWGLAFGGSFTNADQTKVTPDDPNVVKALEWETSVAKKFGGPGNVSVAPKGFPGGGFANGTLGTNMMASPMLTQLPKQAPNLKYGVTMMPYQAPAQPNPVWIAGQSLSLVGGAKNPDAGWQFIKWIGATQEGTQALVQAIGFVPGWKASKGFDTLRSMPDMGIFLDMLQTAHYYLQPIPVFQFYVTQLGNAHDDAIYGRKTAAQALKDCADLTTKEWERFLSEKKK